MKRFAVLPIVTLLLLLLLSSAALATTYNITGMSGSLVLPSGTHTLTGRANNLSIVCTPSVTLTLDGVSVTSSGCALSFYGTGNELILAAGTTNTFISAFRYPGISVAESVADTAELTISGSGTVNAYGGSTGAGIGGETRQAGGTINISSGTVNAIGGPWAAGIGGGDYNNGGTINISGGTVTATGGNAGAGIGGGQAGGAGTIHISGGTVNATGIGGAGIGGGQDGGAGGIINISGGTVNATGTNDGAGIGGGQQGSVGTIHISGGTVTATASSGFFLGGSGIGGGYMGYNGTIEISDGIVYAAADSVLVEDIGSGDSGWGVPFTLSGSAAVFLKNDSYYAPTLLGTQAHYNPVPFVGNTANGITVPAAWTTAQGAFLPPAPAIIAPQTGDSSRIILWFILVGIAGLAIVLLLSAKRKRAY